MKYLRSLIENLTCSCLQGSLDTEVRSIAYDSRKVEEGALFVCIRGSRCGWTYICRGSG